MLKKPPIPPQTREQALHEFIEGSQNRAMEGVVYPWNAPGVREDVVKIFNLRLSEPDFLKLKYLAEHLPNTSMQTICLEAVHEAIENKLNSLTRS